MKAHLITPIDIKYSYRGTEYHVYEYAKYLFEHHVDANILMSANPGRHATAPNWDAVRKRYAAIPKRMVDCTYIKSIHGQNLQIYHGLPKDSVIYFPYNLHNYLINIAFKPRGQKYIIGSHCLQFKLGKLILGDHPHLESVVNFASKVALFWRGKESRNIYFHVINKGQVRYLLKLGVDRKNIFYVTPMIEPEKLKIGSNTSRKLKVLHIGGSDKDSSTVVEIIKQINEAGKLGMFEFYFIGNLKPDEVDELTQLSKAHNNIRLLGRGDDRIKFRTLSNVDVILVVGYEVFPKIILEGLASGLYVLSSNRVAAVADFRDLGVKLGITETGAPLEYIEPLLELAKKKSLHPGSINPYKKRNREILVREFDNSVILPRILKMFLEVMAAE